MTGLSRPFLLDIDEKLNYCFVETSAEKIGHANFLERGKLDFDKASEQKISMLDRPKSHDRSPTNFIFHTAFCGSTLLSRLLHSPPECVVLKEPHVLFRLSEASLSLRDKVLAEHVDYVVSELSQPWCANGSVVIKPTNSCNRIAANLMKTHDKAVYLYSSLEDFMVSCLKKMPEAQSRVNWMARHLLPGSKLEGMLDVPRNTDFSIIEACVLVWHVSLEYMSEALYRHGAENSLILQYSALKADPLSAFRKVSAHLRIENNSTSEVDIKYRLLGDSKNIKRRYDSDANLSHAACVRSNYADAISKGMRWAESYVSKAASISCEFK